MKKPMLFMILTAILGLVVMPANIQAQKVHTDLHIDTSTGNRIATHMAAGGGWSSLILLVNLGTTIANYTVRIYGDTGSPQVFPFKNTTTQTDLGMQSVLTGIIPVGGMVSLKAQDVASSTTTGWALSDPSSTGVIGGAVVFAYQTGQQAVVPFEASSSQKFELIFDNTNGSALGVALVNPEATSVIVSVVFRNYLGATLLSDQIAMTPREHTSFILADRYPALANQFGTAVFSTTSAANAIVGLGILATPGPPGGAFTTVSSLQSE